MVLSPLPFLSHTISSVHGNIFTQILIILTEFLPISSSDISPDVKQEAQDILKQYKPLFEQKVEEVYGSDARLKKVKCDVTTSVTDALPLDHDKFILVKYISSVGFEPMFESEVDYLEKAAESDEGNIITLGYITANLVFAP